MGIESEAALARVHRLTDWNMSCYQSTQEAKLAQEEAKRRGRKACAHAGACSASPVTSYGGASHAFSYQRRSGPRSIMNSITCTHAFALLVESLINYGRIEWLRSRDYEVRMVQYVPDVVTPKNKCLLAVRRLQQPQKRGNE
ncbi:hypothetical protein ABL78_8435 [Leptomonas seymouri]|uniref:tRNA:m(4)X modification enzyme TRM13 n=1 Tax=Leptomonas seymouri TaxID=5684 RepID=A0A0N0P254_LEPSE|nr:hypothetical protein ABL78_8435 [Leptomonas seymouri]|eukprot:KPI82556.1 hypothetical protein ABL78_8435 [Leptomonas seymouri]